MKKIVVTDFDDTGKMQTMATYTLRRSIEAVDFEARKKLVAQVLQMSVLSKRKFTVTWQHQGSPEGYAVFK